MEESNKLFLTSGIIQIERDLLFIMSDLSQTEKTDSVFTKTIDDVGAESKKATIALISDMLGEIKQIKENFGLEQKTIMMSKQILVHLSNIRIVLEDLSSQNLSSYGKMRSDDQCFLDSKITQIREMLGRINAILH